MYGAYSRCALIHCHRPDLIDYHKLDKVRLFLLSLGHPLLTVALSSQTAAEIRNSRLMWQQSISEFRCVYVALAQSGAVLDVRIFHCHT